MAVKNNFSASIVDTIVFRDVGQALHRSFLIASSEGNPRPQLDWLEDMKRGESYAKTSKAWSTGLTPDEMRLEAINVINAVQNFLNMAQQDAIYARFAPPRSPTKRRGMHGLADHGAPKCLTPNMSAIRAIVHSLYHRTGGGKKRRAMTSDAILREEMDRWSLRTIEKEFGCSISTLRRDAGVLKKICQDLEHVALTILEAEFIGRGLIPDPNCY
jgi:hypothetical protein